MPLYGYTVAYVDYWLQLKENKTYTFVCGGPIYKEVPSDDFFYLAEKRYTDVYWPNGIQKDTFGLHEENWVLWIHMIYAPEACICQTEGSDTVCTEP